MKHGKEVLKDNGGNMSENIKILIVDDEESIREILVYNLEKEGYTTIEAADGEEALELVKKEKPDLVLLDVMLPKKDGITVCKEIRYSLGLTEMPILMLSARGEETDKIIGLEIGADDYITKPFHVRVLLARIKAGLRKIHNVKKKQEEQEENDIITIGDLVIDAKKREVRKGNNVLDLTKKEFDVLRFLGMQKGNVVSREDLLRKVWGYTEFIGEIRTIDVTIARLRDKIENTKGEPQILITKRGVGYYLREPINSKE